MQYSYCDASCSAPGGHLIEQQHPRPICPVCNQPLSSSRLCAACDREFCENHHEYCVGCDSIYCVRCVRDKGIAVWREEENCTRCIDAEEEQDA